ncbi:MAG: DUF1467 family protein [Kiloniellales bacterium]|nr:DUF1467 family protein [Kiloniellales bacterium]
MTLFNGIVLYACIWFVVIFTVLPWGVRASDNPEAGHEVGAPEQPRLLLKIGITTVISAAVWVIAYLLITSGLLSVRPN